MFISNYIIGTKQTLKFVQMAGHLGKYFARFSSIKPPKTAEKCISFFFEVTKSFTKYEVLSSFRSYPCRCKDPTQ